MFMEGLTFKSKLPLQPALNPSSLVIRCPVRVGPDQADRFPDVTKDADR